MDDDPTDAIEGVKRGLAALAPSFGEHAQRWDATASLSVPRRVFASPFDVTALAVSVVTAATQTIADWIATHEGPRREVAIDARHVAAAFASERYLSSVGWTLPPVWDPLAGDYAARDGFVRLHTNYLSHREAALRALGQPAHREALAEAVAAAGCTEVEDAVVAAGGCAAVMHTRTAWEAHPAGQALRREPLVAREVRGTVAPSRPATFDPKRPLASLKILDLTRVIAGPVATRFLAAYGADVLRVDPPAFQEVELLLPETTAGKRCTALDLRTLADRRRFEALLADADVLVHGLRPGALPGLGYDQATLRARFPQLILAGVNAYGRTGPWAGRRGFDSLVQMSAGIAAHGQAVAGAARPTPLPVQALDHGTGFLLAAAIVSALQRRATTGEVEAVHVSLGRTAFQLWDLGAAEVALGQALAADEVAPFKEEVATPWGPIQRVTCPGRIEGIPAHWTLPPGPLGSAAPRWS